MNLKDDLKQKCISFYTVITCFAVPIFMAFLFKMKTIFPEGTQALHLYLFAFSLTFALSFYVWKKKIFENRNFLFLFFSILFTTICLRLFLFPHHSADYDSCLHPWVEKMRFFGWPWQISIPITNYNLLYTYILAVISHISFSDLLLIKGVSIIFDGILGVTVLFILKNHFEIRDVGRLLGFSIAMILPSVLLNSGAWGQCDSIYVSFLLIGIYLCLREAPYKGCLFLGLALATKLQAAFVFPILLFFIAYRQISIRHFFIIPLTHLIIALPAWIYGRTFLSIMSIYFSQMQTYENLSMGAPTLWTLVYGDYTLFLPMTFCVAVTVVIVFTFSALYLKQFKTKIDFWDTLFIYSLIVPYFLPKMHERYFYTATILSVLYMFKYPKMWKWSLGIILIDLFGYMPYLFSYSFIENKYLSFFYLFIILEIVINFFKDDKRGVTSRQITALATTSKDRQYNSPFGKALLFLQKTLIILGLAGCFALSVFIIKSDFKGIIDVKRSFELPSWASKKSVQAKAPSWEEKLIFLADDKIIHPSHMDAAEVLKFDDHELLVNWIDGSREHFFKNKTTGIYTSSN